MSLRVRIHAEVRPEVPPSAAKRSSVRSGTLRAPRRRATYPNGKRPM